MVRALAKTVHWFMTGMFGLRTPLNMRAPPIILVNNMRHDRGAPAHGPRFHRNIHFALVLDRGGGPAHTVQHDETPAVLDTKQYKVIGGIRA